MEIKIDKGIPLPSNDARTRYPFAQMEIGDSFFVERKSSAGMGGSYGKLKPKKFSVRTVIENGIKGARVWRVA